MSKVLSELDIDFIVNVMAGDIRGVKRLLEEGANVNARYSKTKPPVPFLALCGDIKLIKLLLKYGANFKGKDEFGDTAIISAVSCPNNGMELVKLFLKEGLDVNEKNSQGDTALSLAVYYRQLDMVKMLLDFGANPNIVNKNGDSALVLAAWYKYKELVELLLKHGEISEDNKKKALKVARKEHSIEIIKVLKGT